MIYVLTYPRFDSETAAAIEGYRAKYEPDRARLVNAHVTLVFGLSNAEPAAFAAFCEKATSTVRPFPVVFDQCETLFHPVEEAHKICLTCSEGEGDLASLHTALYDGPHCQIACNRDPHFAFNNDPIGGALIDGLGWNAARQPG